MLGLLQAIHLPFCPPYGGTISWICCRPTASITSSCTWWKAFLYFFDRVQGVAVLQVVPSKPKIPKSKSLIPDHGHDSLGCYWIPHCRYLRRKPSWNCSTRQSTMKVGMSAVIFKTSLSIAGEANGLRSPMGGGIHCHKSCDPGCLLPAKG